MRKCITDFLILYFFPFFITSCALNTVSVYGSSITVPSEQYPTISQAILKVRSGDTIWVEEGVYKENIVLSPGITLISKTLFKAIIDGNGASRVVVMGNRSVLSGFSVTNGRFGVYSEGTGNSIIKCFIRDNKQSGISCVGHLPRIEDNLIIENEGSGIQGWDVRSTISSINHNTIAYNANHGIAIGGSSELVIENNIIAHNEKLGLKVEPTVKAKLVKNNFYFNADILTTLPSDNYVFDPMFLSPREMNFLLAQESKCRNIATDNKNLGVRIVY